MEWGWHALLLTKALYCRACVTMLRQLRLQGWHILGSCRPDVRNLAAPIPKECQYLWTVQTGSGASYSACSWSQWSLKPAPEISMARPDLISLLPSPALSDLAATSVGSSGDRFGYERRFLWKRWWRLGGCSNTSAQAGQELSRLISESASEVLIFWLLG